MKTKKSIERFFCRLTLSFIFTVLVFSCGPGEPTDSLLDYTAPTPGDSGLILATVSQDSVALSWNMACDDICADSDLLYKVYYSQNAGAVSSSSGLSTASGLGDFSKGLSSATVTGLAEATMYYFNVAVKDTEGNLSLYSVKDARTLDVTAPVVSNHVLSVTGTPSDTLTLNWTAASDSTDLTYHVYQSTSANIDTLESIEENGGAALVSIAGTSTQITGQPLDMDYINVVATDEDGNQATYSMATVDNRNNVAGSVVDGYIRNALVCLDSNLNDECDDGEPHQKTDASGEYDELMVSETELEAIDVPVILLQGGVDIATGERFTSILKAPVINGNTQVNLSPITGILAQKLITAAEADPAFVLDTSELDSAKKAVANTLGLSNPEHVIADPVVASQTLGSEGKSLLQKAIQIQKIVEIAAAAEKDATGDTETDNANKRAKTSNVLKALAAQMDSSSKDMNTIIEGMADATADVPKAATIKTSLQAVADKVETAFTEKTDMTSMEAINQVNTIAETISEAIEAQVDNDWAADAAKFAEDFDTTAVTTELASYDITGDANIWEKMEVDRLLRMAGVDQTTDVSDAQYDYMLSELSSDAGIDGTTTIDEFLDIFVTYSDATFDAAKPAVVSLINRSLVEYANLLTLNNLQTVTIDASEMAYFSFFSPTEASYYFALSSGTVDLSTDVTVSLYSDSRLVSPISLSAIDTSTSSLQKLEPADYMQGEYWLKIENNSGSAISFNIETTLKQELVTHVYQKLLIDDMSDDELKQEIWFNDQEWIVGIDSGQLVLGTKSHDLIRFNSPWGSATLTASNLQGISFDISLLENKNTDNRVSGFYIHPIYIYNTSGDVPVGVTFFLGQQPDGMTTMNFSPVKCTNTSNCDEEYTDLGLDVGNINVKLTEGVTHSVSIVWNEMNETLTVGYDGNSTSIDMSTAAPFSNSISNTEIRFNAGVNDLTTFNQPPVLYTVGIDNINIDTGSGLTAYETFSSNEFDTSKWINAHGQYMSHGAFRITSIDNSPGTGSSPYIRAESFKADITMQAQAGNGNFALLRPAYLNGSNTVFTMMFRSENTFTQTILQAPNSEVSTGEVHNAEVLYKRVLGTTSLGETNTIYAALKENVIQFQLDNGALIKVTPFDLGIIPTNLPKDFSKMFQSPTFVVLAMGIPSIPEIGGSFDFAAAPAGSYADVLVDNIEVLTGKITTTNGKDWEFSSVTLYDDFSSGYDAGKWQDFDPSECSGCSTQFSDGKMTVTTTYPSSDYRTHARGINFNSENAAFSTIQGFSADLRILNHDGLGLSVGAALWPDWLNSFMDDMPGGDALAMSILLKPCSKQVIYTINAAWGFSPIVAGTLKAVDDLSTVVNVAIGFDGTYAYFKADDQTTVVKITDYYPVSSAGKVWTGLYSSSGLNDQLGSVTAEFDNVRIGGF